MESSNKTMWADNVNREVVKESYPITTKSTRTDHDTGRQVVKIIEKQSNSTDTMPDTETTPIIGGVIIPYAGTESPNEAAIKIKPNHQLYDPIAYGI